MLEANSKADIKIREIKQTGDRALCILWADGVEQFFDVVMLRRLCPCAACVDELSGRRTLKPEDIKETIRPVNVQSVGRYALTIAFDDQHKTGIYTFDYLRQLQAAELKL